MPVHAGSGRVSERVHEHLRRDILEGRLAPGAAVPSERVLAADLQANRHAVREALKRLEQAGLVRISQGGPTRVLDWRDSGGLEVLLDLVGHRARPRRAEARQLAAGGDRTLAAAHGLVERRVVAAGDDPVDQQPDEHGRGHAGEQWGPEALHRCTG